MQICTTCVLDSQFPGISFDDDGVCNYCRAKHEQGDREEHKRRYEQQFRDLIAAHGGKSAYDCVAAFSGGKDSTYTLHLLKRRYNLRVLAFSFDNWYQSDAATRNIKAVLRGLGIDHLTVTPDYDIMHAVIKASVSRDLHSAQALMRASSICTSCISLIRFIGLQIAIEKKIPFMIFGFTPGQAPLATSVVKITPRMARMMQGALLDRLVERVGDPVRSFFLQERHFQDEEAFPYSINLLAFTEYDERRIYETAFQYGWRNPRDTDPNSTNCLLNAYANHVHIQQFGYNPYAYEVAELVRSGYLSRGEGLSRLSTPQAEGQIVAIEQALEDR
jgi:hypothetical protein